MKTSRLFAALCAVAAVAAAPAPAPKDGKCGGTLEIVSFDRAAVSIELKNDQGETGKIAVDESAVPGWRTYFNVGDKVTVTCSVPPERGKLFITKIQKVQ
jgi:hypothetical protein